jgi:hypothetical protein
VRFFLPENIADDIFLNSVEKLVLDLLIDAVLLICTALFYFILIAENQRNVSRYNL